MDLSPQCHDSIIQWLDNFRDMSISWWHDSTHLAGLKQCTTDPLEYVQKVAQKYAKKWLILLFPAKNIGNAEKRLSLFLILSAHNGIILYTNEGLVSLFHSNMWKMQKQGKWTGVRSSCKYVGQLVQCVRYCDAILPALPPERVGSVGTRIWSTLEDVFSRCSTGSLVRHIQSLVSTGLALWWSSNHSFQNILNWNSCQRAAFLICREDRRCPTLWWWLRRKMIFFGFILTPDVEMLCGNFMRRHFHVSHSVCQFWTSKYSKESL